MNEYPICLTGGKAATHAGYAPSVDQTASRLLRNGKNAATLAEAQKERDERQPWTQERIIEELAASADEAWSDGQFGAAKRAQSLISKHLGVTPLDLAGSLDNKDRDLEGM